MKKPTHEDILRMNPDELDYLLNQCLTPLFSEFRMGDRARHYSFNPVDASDAKAALRKLGLKFKFGEFEQGGPGCCAAFYWEPLESGKYDVYTETSEEIATARAAALAIVEKTDLFEKATSRH